MVPNVESSKFDLSHDKKLTFDMGEIVPICCMEALPGDRFHLNYVNMLRFAPLIAPVMHKVRVKTEYFFVPNRILWPDAWEDFICGTEDVLAPYIRLADIVSKGSVFDYFGIPPGDYAETPVNISALQFAGYLKIYDDWYRDQNLITEKFIDLIPGNNTLTLFDILNEPPLRRAWEHDYFTSALPFSQQGTEVDIPLTFQNDIPVVINPTGLSGRTVDASGTPFAVAGTLTGDTSGALVYDTAGADSLSIYDPRGSLVVDVQSDAATINDLREAFSLQAFLERSIRGGLRYFEQMFSHFKQKSPDMRLQRPELIGTGTQLMTISEVLATAQSLDVGDEISVGTMAGHGISVGGDESLFYNVEEHGFIMGFISVIPDTAYQDGIHKSFTRFDRLDYAWPSFAHLGEQEIRNKEILAHDIPTGVFPPEGIFGYVPRYSEYRYIPSGVAGDFRDTLAFWTLGRQFTAADVPTLSEEFVTADPSTRIFAVELEGADHIFAQVINAHSVVRKLPRYGVPSTLG